MQKSFIRSFVLSFSWQIKFSKWQTDARAVPLTKIASGISSIKSFGGSLWLHVGVDGWMAKRPTSKTSCAGVTQGSIPVKKDIFFLSQKWMIKTNCVGMRRNNSCDCNYGKYLPGLVVMFERSWVRIPAPYTGWTFIHIDLL